jgi:hypothetical protein
LIFNLIGTKNVNIGASMINAGIGMLPSSFEVFVSNITPLVQSTNNITKESTNNFNPIHFAISLVLIVLGGIFYYKNINDRFYLLNFINFSRKSIDEKETLKDLNLTGYKLRENKLDVVRVFGDGTKLDEKDCKYVIEEIEEKIIEFCSQGKEFKNGFTGMFSIPFTMIAGTFLTGQGFNEYFEYNRKTGKYYALKEKKRIIERNKLQKLELKKDIKDKSSNEAIVIVSITQEVQKEDIKQFNPNNVLHFYSNEINDNIITTKKALHEYSENVISGIKDLKEELQNLEIIHFVGAFPSCFSIELGKKIKLLDNRFPKIISYHYKYQSNPKYIFGIVVNGKDFGKLVKKEGEVNV